MSNTVRISSYNICMRIYMYVIEWSYKETSLKHGSYEETKGMKKLDTDCVWVKGVGVVLTSSN